MADKVLCEKSDLVAIADSVREATETYSVPELSTAITDELTEQADLINQIQTALEGKAAGAAGGGGGSVETCTVTLTRNMATGPATVTAMVYYTGVNSNGNIEAQSLELAADIMMSDTVHFICVKNTMIHLNFATTISSVTGGTSHDLVYYNSSGDVYARPSGVTATDSEVVITVSC